MLTIMSTDNKGRLELLVISRVSQFAYRLVCSSSDSTLCNNS